MDFDSSRRLRTSSSRNFSRPFPSPLSTGALSTPTRPSKSRDFVAGAPLSATPGNTLRRVSSHDDLTINRLISFTIPPRPAAIAPSNHENLHSPDTNIIVSAPSSAGTSASFSSADLSVDHDFGTKPILNFRPHLWHLLDRNRPDLSLDLFWPDEQDTARESEYWQDQEHLQPIVFPYDGLRPLPTFHNLRTLQLTGMLPSYQPLIWATCWMNPNLTTLHLEMALEPLINISSHIPHRVIDGSWSLRSNMFADEEEPEYLGHHGTGTLHEEFGDGEYLDTQAIKLARNDVADDMPDTSVRYLPIRKLTLMNFVVDGWPIMRWFDPRFLEEIIFKSGCMDAGFYLPYHMMHVKVHALVTPTGVAKVVKPGDLKLIDLDDMEVISRRDAAAERSTQPLQASVNGKEQTLRHKFSQLLPRLPRRGSLRRNKENASNIVGPQVVEPPDFEEMYVFSEEEIRAAKDGKKPAR